MDTTALNFDPLATGDDGSCEVDLALVAPAIKLSGSVCVVEANVHYLLQPTLVNGRPHYLSVDGKLHIYGGKRLDGSCWYIDSDTNRSTSYAYPLPPSPSP